MFLLCGPFLFRTVSCYAEECDVQPILLDFDDDKRLKLTDYRLLSPFYSKPVDLLHVVLGLCKITWRITRDKLYAMILTQRKAQKRAARQVESRHGSRPKAGRDHGTGSLSKEGSQNSLPPI